MGRYGPRSGQRVAQLHPTAPSPAKVPDHATKVECNFPPASRPCQPEQFSISGKKGVPRLLVMGHSVPGGIFLDFVEQLHEHPVCSG